LVILGVRRGLGKIAYIIGKQFVLRLTIVMDLHPLQDMILLMGIAY
jgi:hypothetical protein